MATVRFEIKKFGRSRGSDAQLVPAIVGQGATGVFTPTGASQIGFGPVDKECEVIVKAIGAAIYATFGPHSPTPPVTGIAPIQADYLPAGGHGVFKLKAGDSIAVMTANLS